MPEINENLSSAYKILKEKNEYMSNFMNYYLFERVAVDKRNILSDKKHFESLIGFCLHTRQRLIKKDFDHGMKYFSQKYEIIKKYVSEAKIEELREIIYSCKGVGQKIGSFILEAFIHYGKANLSLEKYLYLPIDVHNERILKESFNVPVPNSEYGKKSYLEFQSRLRELADLKQNDSIIYLDYLWFIGKMFCQKTKNSKDRLSRGYRLCNECWINKCCLRTDKWM